MAFSMDYGGVPLNLDTAEFAQFLDLYLPDFGDYIAPPAEWPGQNLLGIPFRSVQRPRLKIGQWYYPTGLSRWSEVNLITTSSNTPAADYHRQLRQVAFPSLDGPPVANLFTMRQGVQSVSTAMYMLPMRPLTSAGDPAAYLATFVDQRYFFLNSSVSLSINYTTTWRSLFTAVAGNLGIALTVDPIPAAYGQPEPDSDLASLVVNTALIGDALAYNVGMKIVRNLDGTYEAQSNAIGRTVALGNFALVGGQLAGGDALASF